MSESSLEVVKVNWSGGKDSTCALSLHLYAGHKVKAVCYIPELVPGLPLVRKCHYDFLHNTADKFRLDGAEVHFIHGLSYYDYVTRRSSRGKYEGRAFGFPCPIRGMCGFKRDSKLKALRSYSVGKYDYEDVGIAFDEFRRYVNLSDSKRSILVERRWTESIARFYCFCHDLLSPIYFEIGRDGCALCPHASKNERDAWFTDYPEAIPIVLELQDFVRRERPEQFPLRNHEWFL